MIVHAAVRKKVPLKKKVRTNGKKSSSKSSNALKLTTTQQSSAPNNKSLPIQTMVTTTPAALSTPQVIPVPVKRQKDAKKHLKKKRKLSVDEPQPNINIGSGNLAGNIGVSKSSSTNEVTIAPIKPKKHKKSSNSNKQEVIDYSSRTETHTNTFGKVQKWLMDNPLMPSITTPVPQINHTAHVSKINKSISTPERLSQRSPNKAKLKTKSVGNINEKVRLQVVYKPPFKFSLKLSKNDKTGVKTQVVSGNGGGRKKNRIDSNKKRVGVETSSAPQAPKRRSAILISSDQTADKIEPAYESMPVLIPKKETLPSYDNIYNNNASSNLSPPINTATYRINKSPSGASMHQISSTPLTKSATSSAIPSNSKNHSSSSFNKYNKGSESTLNLLLNMNPNGHNRRSSLSTTTNLSKQYGGSSQNLMRSSTTNLTKANRNSFHTRPHNYELSRSSTTNLTKDYNHRHFGSTKNLRRSSTDDLPGGGGRSRKNSSASRHNSNNMSRTPSCSNIKAVRHHGSNSNLPRANVIKPGPSEIQRQISLQTKVGGGNTPRPDYNLGRPHTSSCDGANQQFEWPKSLSLERKLKDEPLPSDLEVLVSDAENILQDR